MGPTGPMGIPNIISSLIAGLSVYNAETIIYHQIHAASSHTNVTTFKRHLKAKLFTDAYCVAD